ncbi:BTAD domain-containing putative transcriptional regulator [Rhodococcus sp. PvR099]|uniref:AfsR/SARP family transcriptional regulator n=1 Tax=Rhodococcus sp. PvR099 TaxID=2806602 RepID=UPI001B4DA529|nr:BTAD domain-containing putative transcriptional regulator [Rhodococcus sp. PvR099]MBP1159101.1 DNA-binding SARP family transcriptional activator [Rhodococcus sp. PvR099]
MSADRLLAQVWHDLDQPKLSSLHVAISKLRDLLSPDRARREDGVLVRDGSRYPLSAARGSVDVARFEELVRTGAEVAETSADAAAAAYLEALSLWRGSPYADIAGSEFTTPEIARLTAMHLETRRSLLEVGLRRERFAEVAAEAEALAAEHPLDERIWEILVLALYRGGRQSDALGALRRIRAILDDELGIDPGVALRRLEAAVLAQDAALHGQAAPRPAQPDPPRAPNLPSPRSLLVGRAADIESVATALGEHPLVTLVGPGGVGKTRLAIEVARRRRAADGPWMVDLGALTDGALMVPAVASALGLPGVGGAEHLAGVLAGRTMLMILDNCEHVVADAAALAVTLADLCPGVQLLATSREPREVDGEALHEVPPLAPDEARDLFAALAGGVVPGWPSARPMSRRCARSAPNSTASRSASNSRPHSCGCSPSSRSPTGWRIASPSCGVGLEAPHPDSAGSRTPSTGATGCSTTSRRWCSGRWRCSRAASTSTEPRP